MPVAALSGPRSMLKYANQPLKRFEDARALSPRAVAFKVLGLEYIVFFEPAAIEQILVTRHAELIKDRFTHDLRRVLGTGLLTSEGELWKRRRRLVAPSLQRPEIGAYAPVMAERAEAFAAAQTDGSVVDVHSCMMHLTLDVLVRSLFGTELSRAAEVERLLDALMQDYLPVAEAIRVWLPDWFPVPSRRRLARLSGELDGLLLELINERKRGAALPSEARGGDLLTRLMRARDEEGSLTDAALRDEAMTLFLAGHETTALALTFALRLLALHPPEERRLHDELASVLRGRAPTMSDLPALPFTRAVVDEALRLYPPAWALGREAGSDLEIRGVLVPKGTQLLVSPWLLHRDARFFPDPHRFVPARWLQPPAPERFAYLPFGAGPRVCIGQHFALIEAALILATLVQRVHFQLTEQPPLELLPAVTLRPRAPVLMQLTHRTQSGNP